MLTSQGLERGYYPEPSKSVLIVHPENLESGKEFSTRRIFKVCAGSLYLGGYIRDDNSRSTWMKESILAWENNINTFSKTIGKYPQDSCAVVIRSIQSEWIFLQRVTWDTEDEFAGVEKMIRETFLPRLFYGKTKTLSPIVGILFTIPIKVAGLRFLNSVTLKKDKYISFHQESAELTRAIPRGGG